MWTRVSMAQFRFFEPKGCEAGNPVGILRERLRPAFQIAVISSFGSFLVPGLTRQLAVVQGVAGGREDGELQAVRDTEFPEELCAQLLRLRSEGRDVN